MNGTPRMSGYSLAFAKRLKLGFPQATTSCIKCSISKVDHDWTELDYTEGAGETLPSALERRDRVRGNVPKS